MPVDDILMDCEEHMEKSIEHLKHELRGVRTGRHSHVQRTDCANRVCEVRGVPSPGRIRAFPIDELPGSGEAREADRGGDGEGIYAAVARGAGGCELSR